MPATMFQNEIVAKASLSTTSYRSSKTTAAASSPLGSTMSIGWMRWPNTLAWLCMALSPAPERRGEHHLACRAINTLVPAASTEA